MGDHSDATGDVGASLSTRSTAASTTRRTSLLRLLARGPVRSNWCEECCRFCKGYRAICSIGIIGRCGSVPKSGYTCRIYRRPDFTQFSYISGVCVFNLLIDSGKDYMEASASVLYVVVLVLVAAVETVGRCFERGSKDYSLERDTSGTDEFFIEEVIAMDNCGARIIPTHAQDLEGIQHVWVTEVSSLGVHLEVKKVLDELLEEG